MLLFVILCLIVICAFIFDRYRKLKNDKEMENEWKMQQAKYVNSVKAVHMKWY